MEELLDFCNEKTALLEPVISYRVVLPDGCDSRLMAEKFKILEEEDPKLKITYKSHTGDFHCALMGTVQSEIFKSLFKERFGTEIDTADGKVMYKETVENTVEGIGHFEPLRHYSEVHLIIEPLPSGSGLVFDNKCDDTELDRNWQRLILTHLAEKTHLGVLTGSPLTDVKITLVGGRAHIKHTEGGDFRQATYRAVRQGLMKARNVLLEPYLRFRLEIPTALVGRALTDSVLCAAKLFRPKRRVNIP